MSLLSLHKDYEGLLNTLNDDFDFMDVGISKVAKGETRNCAMCNEIIKQDEFILFSLPRKYHTEKRDLAIKPRTGSSFLTKSFYFHLSWCPTEIVLPREKLVSRHLYCALKNDDFMTELYYTGEGSYGHFDLISSIQGAIFFIPTKELKEMNKMVHEISLRKKWQI